jgi:large subunit ribosomal protein L10
VAMSTSRTCRVTPASSSVRLGNSSLRGNAVTAKRASVRPAAFAPLKVEAALSRDDKKGQVAVLKEMAEGSLLVAGMTYQGTSVKRMMAFRRSLPADAKFVVSKNTLMKLAVQGTVHEEFAAGLKGPNGFLMVGEDGMKDALKACSTLQKESAKAEGKEPLLWAGGSLDGAYFTPDNMKKLESLPSKTELMEKIAYLVKQVPTKVALAVNAMPRKVGYAAAALKTKMEEEEESA